MKNHSWIWHRTWRFWGIPTRQCIRCKALLRVEKLGPRGGKWHSYRAPGAKEFFSVATLPECGGPLRRAGGGPPVSPGATSSSSAEQPAVGPTERRELVGDVIARYEQHAAEWRAKGRVKEAEAMDDIVSRLKDGSATDPRTVAR